MATFDIEKRLEDAIKATLAAASGITAIGATVVRGFDAASEKSIGASGLVAVHCSGFSHGVLGIHATQVADPAYVSIGVWTRVSSDLTGDNIIALAAAVDDVMADTAIVTTLNAASSGLHIYDNGMILTDRNRDDGGGYRQITLSFEIHATVTS